METNINIFWHFSEVQNLEKDQWAQGEMLSASCHQHKTTHPRKLKLTYYKVFVRAAHQVKWKSHERSLICLDCHSGHILVSVSITDSLPSQHTQEDQHQEPTQTQKVEPWTAERKKELQHYLKLKRYTAFLLSDLECVNNSSSWAS